MLGTVNEIFTLKNFKERQKISEYVQDNLFNTKERASILHIFEENVCIPNPQSLLAVLEGMAFIFVSHSNREFWPRIFQRLRSCPA